jgi:uncharacterized protein YkwD
VRTTTRLRPWLLFAAVAATLAACSDRGTGSAGDRASAKAACAALPAPDPGIAQAIEPLALDQWLFDAAILQAVNAERCRRDIRPLTADPALARSASMHGGDMVVHEFFDHVSPVAGRRSLRERTTLTGANYPRLAENLAAMPLYDTAGRHVYVLDRENCAFSLTPNGAPLPRLSYAEAADAAVEIWMDSSGHRRNLLSPDLSRHGAGAAIRPDPEKCGELLIVLDLAGEQ